MLDIDLPLGPLSQKQKDEAIKKSNKLVFEKIVECLYFTKDEALTLSVAAKTHVKPLKLQRMVVVKDGINFSLRNFYEAKYCEWDRHASPAAKGAIVEEIVEDYAAIGNLVPIDKYQKIRSRYGDLLRAKLYRVRQRLSIRGKTNISVGVRLKGEANLDIVDEQLKRDYLDNIIPVYTKLYSELSEIEQCIKRCETKDYAKFRVMTLGIDEITELLHARLEYLH